MAKSHQGERAPVLPVAISQTNCAAVGMSERQWLDFCRSQPGLVAKIGKLRVVAVADFLDHVRRTAAEEKPEEVSERDALLARVGRRVA